MHFNRCFIVKKEPFLEGFEARFNFSFAYLILQIDQRERMALVNDLCQQLDRLGWVEVAAAVQSEFFKNATGWYLS